MIDYVIIGFCVLITVLLVLLLASVRKKKENESDIRLDAAVKGLGDNLVRSESMAEKRGEALRESVSFTVSEMGKRVDGLREDMHRVQLETVKAITDMKDSAGVCAKEQSATVAAAVEKLQQSNEKKLDEMRTVVDEKLTGVLSERLDSSFKTVSEQLGNVYKSLGEMREISGGITALNRVLAGVKTRGNWAESQLETILDSTVPGMYVKNYSVYDSREVVEFAVKIPAQDDGSITYMPLDSKFPMEDYLRLCDASDAADTEAVKAARKALEKSVLSQAKAVSKYVLPPQTTPFAVMYLATDSLYAEIVSSKENIVDKVHSEYNVLIAGPSTVTALLSSLAMGFRTAALNKNANEVMKILAAAKAQYDKFSVTLNDAKKKLDTASKGIEEAQKRNDIILKNLKGVEVLDSAEADTVLSLTDSGEK